MQAVFDVDNQYIDLTEVRSEDSDIEEISEDQYYFNVNRDEVIEDIDVNDPMQQPDWHFVDDEWTPEDEEREQRRIRQWEREAFIEMLRGQQAKNFKQKRKEATKPKKNNGKK